MSPSLHTISCQVALMSPKSTPKSPRSPKSPKKQNSRFNSLNSPTTVSPGLAHMAPNALQIEWQYLNSTLINHQHEAEHLVRKLASLQAQRDAGEYQKLRPLLRKITLIQAKIHNSTTQQNSLMIRVNQLALEIRHRQFVAEEFQQRIYSPQVAMFSPYFFGPTPIIMAPQPTYQPATMTSIETIMSPDVAAVSSTFCGVTCMNIAAVQATSQLDGYQTREETPSLGSDMCWDEMVEQESPLIVATATPSIDCMSTSSCPTSPQIVSQENVDDLSLATLNLALDTQKRRQSMCAIPSTKLITL